MYPLALLLTPLLLATTAAAVPYDEYSYAGPKDQFDNGVSWSAIRPSGNVLLRSSDGTNRPPDSTPEYMACRPLALDKGAHQCDGKAITRDVCHVSCDARKRDGKSAKVECSGWNKCKGKTMKNHCLCNVGYWLQEENKGKKPPGEEQGAKLALPKKEK